ncbi:phosphomannomutase/phosphoglucomutase [Sphaerochaeta halotolerans]|jgi:phosphomannomutase|uniref:Phosphomannomutase/phosphoglucomutase n=1 Tax=Sphaerochaeta halotolerans TaxID=2293840 RepID=A0A372MJK7_9SPIR|nr:phosphomannomutase/phosphoglucomutase [Sphaerochaeta halotolerans]RFU95360.1 phosphomannomutase/phosphoglucomutase [Sphaerochaeta halotolerans]
MGAFKAYDIRGIYNKDFNKETVYKIGYFLPKLLKSKVVLVGRDVRTSSEEIFESLCNGITDSGADVYDIGLATTPMVYFSTVHFNVDASVQITASHNPAIYNGLKISRAKAVPVGSDSGLKELEMMVNNDPVVISEQKGSIQKKDAKEPYLAFLKQYVPDTSGLNLSIDCSHGMANLLVKDLLGSDHHYLYDHFDGTFPAHEPNPLEIENCEDLQNAVLQNKSDIGVIYDGDADRVMFLDEKGRFLQPDYITAVLGYYYLRKEKGNVLVDIRTSRSTTEYLTNLGATVHVWKVGHAFAKTKLRDLRAIFGGELAGHYYFRDFYNCDSGFLASLLVLQVVAELKKQGMTIGEFIDTVIVYANSGEMNFKLEQKDEAMQALFDRYVTNDKPEKVMDFDGYRIEFSSWWFNVRKSNTEPYLRLVVEAKTKEELQERTKELSTIIKQFN